MTSETQKIYDAYKSNDKFAMGPMTQLSIEKNSGETLVSDSTKAFNFDSITKQIYKKKNKPKSVDALYINNKVCFIEFKYGYRTDGNNNEEYMENIVGSAKDSLCTHCGYLAKFPNIQVTKSSHILIAVINSGKNGRASSALGEALANRASLDTALKSKLKAQLMGYFLNGLSYGEIDVWNDINFSTKLLAET